MEFNQQTGHRLRFKTSNLLEKQMKGTVAKAELTALFKEVWRSSGNKIKRLDVRFAGQGAGIRFRRRRRKLSATVLLPALDNTEDVPQDLFDDLTGYALHELGHAWFTDNDPWDDAVREYGKVLGSIINGIEDCRVELAVIRSGYADNARARFVQLCNNVFADGFDNTMIENVAAVIAIEGRRLNGYELLVPDLFSSSPWRVEIGEALRDMPSCKSTADVVKVAVELWLKIKEDQGACIEQYFDDGDCLEYLSPTIVEAILDGKYPAHLTLKDLMQPFPLEWDRQVAHFFVENPSTNGADIDTQQISNQT